jgi:uncharacterized protein Usg
MPCLSLRGLLLGHRLVDDAHDVGLLHDQELFTIDFYDLCPAFPALNKFLNFWLETLEGPLHSVTVAHARLIKPAEIRAIDGEFRLH